MPRTTITISKKIHKKLKAEAAAEEISLAGKVSQILATYYNDTMPDVRKPKWYEEIPPVFRNFCYKQADQERLDTPGYPDEYYQEFALQRAKLCKAVVERTGKWEGHLVDKKTFEIIGESDK